MKQSVSLHTNMGHFWSILRDEGEWGSKISKNSVTMRSFKFLWGERLSGSDVEGPMRGYLIVESSPLVNTIHIGGGGVLK